jgi:CheY-like chemotaxis protein
MGIPISARLAALMGGSLLVTDRGGGGGGGGGGTAFTLRLPLVSGAPLPPLRDSSSVRSLHEGDAVKRRPIAGSRVLVVDDVAANRRLALFMLRQLGCVGGQADDGDAVLPALRAAAGAGAPYDIVLMDIMMERLNGDASLVELRAQGEALPVIACTGNATGADAERYAGLGFAGVLPKPFKREELAAALQAVAV